MKKLTTLVFIMISFLSIANYASAATLHIFIITDSDPKIGSNKDKALLSDLSDQIGRITNMTVKKKTFDKNDTRFIPAIQRLTPGSDDVVWVYYSGHGRNDNGRWPLFTTSNGAYKYKLTSIRDLLNSKNARLNLIMYDCCNHGSAASTNPSSRLTPSALDILFRTSKGTIIATGASPGKFGYGSPQIGGFFTVSFIKALNEVSPADGNNLWKVVFEKTRAATNAMCQRSNRTSQTPIYKLIEVSNDSSCNVPVQVAPEKEKPNAIDPFNKL